MDLTASEMLLAVAIVALGTAVQASIGFGLAMIAAPLLLLIDRALVPGPLIAAALVLVLWMAFRERGAIDLSHFRAGVIGRIAGTPPAALLMGTMSAAAFDIVFGVLVMLAVAISLMHPHIRPTPRSVFFATAASGFMSTISSIGGPPLALVYQNAQGPALRANLAMLFIFGCTISLLALSLVGRFGLLELGYAGLLSAGVGLGVLASGPLQRHMDRRAVRPYLLGLCFVSASLVLVRAFFVV